MTRNDSYSTSLRARLLGMTALTGLVAATTAFPTSDAQASGFALKEQSASAQGNSFAGATAGAEDVTYMFFNPAGLTRQEESQASVVLSYVIPTTETNDATDLSGSLPGASSQDGGVSAAIPALYGLWSLSSDLKFGVSVNVPFGMSTEYDPFWQGAFHALKSEIKSVNINPAIAYRVNDMISLGAGLQVQHLEATLTSFDGVGTLEVTGDDWGFGFNLGALIEFSPETRLGLNYRSQVAHTLDGTATVPSSGLTDIGVTADLTTPDTASIGLYHDLSADFAVMAEVAWTGWSSFDQYQVVTDAGPVLGTTPENWNDVFFYGVGATWKPNQDWTIRGGVAFDESPIPDAYRTPRLPGSDRTWLSIGAQFRPSANFTVDAGYSHIFMKEAVVDLAPGYSTPALPGFQATYDNSVDIIAVSGTFRF